ncbi:MAG: class I SAM-dependent methyltransferase [Mycobacterium sp.]|nr:class I SAM-dependent methyltransferase [Mycobacterium sp.]
MTPRPADAAAARWTPDAFRASWADNTLGEIDFLTRTLGVKSGARILDIGCGIGRHAIEFARRGARVVGVDNSAPLIESARVAAGALPVRFVVADTRTIAFQAVFDVVVNLYDGAIGYASDEHTNDALFASIGAALVPGGRSVLHVQNAEHFAVRDHFKSWTVGARALTLTEYRWSAHERRLVHSGHILPFGESLHRPLPTTSPPVSYRLYTLDELVQRLTAAHLRVDAVFRGFDEQQPAMPGCKEFVVISTKEQ